MILITYGTRPEFIKVKPLISEMKNRKIKFKTLFTGQHKDIVSKEADFNISIDDNDNFNRLDSIMRSCLNVPEEHFKDIRYIIVQGDTTSVVGLAISALHRKIKVIHLEAGLRSGDTENPYPEENNRKIVSTIADIHLCPTENNKENLLKENLKDNVYVVGNTVLDNLINYKDKCSYDNKVLITLHRRENHNKIDRWFRHLNEISKKYPEIEFILPIHPNPNVIKHKDILTNVNVIDPLEHESLINILVKCKMVITDSGGLQEECSFFNKKCLVCREVTERPESIGLTTYMVDKPESLGSLFDEHINKFYIDTKSPFGDGNSSKLICDILEKIIINKNGSR